MSDSNHQVYYVLVDVDSPSINAWYVQLFSQETFTITAAYYSYKYGPVLAGYTNNFASSLPDYPNPTLFNQQIGFIDAMYHYNRCNGGD